MANKDNQNRGMLRKAIHEVAAQHPKDSFLQSRLERLDFFDKEFNQVIRARGIETLEAYQKVERVGLSAGLDRERHRPLVWQVYERYKAKLAAAGLVDFEDLPMMMLKRDEPLPQYDAVILDEAQDLKPIHLTLAAKLVDPKTSQGLTILADPAQSIYYRGISWRESGINVRGNRTRTLTKNFRNTQQILAAAKGVLDQCADLQKEDEYLAPTSTDRPGAKPILLKYDEEAHAMAFVVSEIVRLCQQDRYRLSDVAILARIKDTLHQIEKPLKGAHLPHRFFKDENFDILENEIKLLTMHSAKGLEFPIVFLLGLSDDHVPYATRQSESADEDLAQERKLFYVSMTRASERLYLLAPKKGYSRFLHDIQPDTVVEKRLP